MVEILDYLMAMAEGRVGRHQLDRCRENNNMEELEEEEEGLGSVYDYEEYRYDYSDEEYSEENYDNEEENEDEDRGLLVEANAIPAVYNTWNPLRGEVFGGGITQVAVENDVKLGGTKNKENVGTESYMRLEAEGDATQKEEKSERLSQQVNSEKVLVKKSSEYNIWEERKSEKEKIEKDDNWERKTIEKQKSEESDQLSSSSVNPLHKDDFWEEDRGGFLDLGGGGGEKSEKWGQELFVRSSQSRFEPFCIILISSLIFNSCNT